MSDRRRDDLIDFILGELPAEREAEVSARIAAEPEAAAERDLYVEAIALVREAADAGWEAPPARKARLVWLRPAIAVAAVVLVVVGIFALGGGVPRDVVYEPDEAFGYLLPEETDAAGNVPAPSTTNEIRLVQGGVELTPLGSRQGFKLEAGDTIAYDTTIRTHSATGAVRIDLPHGGILFLDSIADVRVRKHQAGGVALRFLDGSGGVVAGSKPIHVSVEGTDLLLAVNSGATLVRTSPVKDAIALRGHLDLLLAGGKRFRVPEGERLPAACAKEPQTTPVKFSSLALGWYRDLVYEEHACESIVWAKPGVSAPITAGADAFLYLHLVPERSGKLELSFGGDTRSFAVRKDHPLKLRLRLRDLGPGPVLKVSDWAKPHIARTFEPDPN